jgi:hypothetical protein
VKKLLLFTAAVWAAWLYFHDSDGKWRGIPAADEPRQTSSALPSAFSHEGYSIKPLARYNLTAVVLSRSRYRNDAAASFAPVDLALGWGPMSIASVINELNISQSGRWYEYTWSGDAPLEPAKIARHSANTHCVPANPKIRDELLAVKRHELVSLDGYLVEITNADGYRWRSSLSRDDTQGGACEVMWITAVSSRKL